MSNGLVSGNSQNSAGGSTPRSRSKFNLAYQFFDTHRFGEYHPFFVMECVDSDNIGARCQHDVRSYTLKAPLMQDIKMKKDYFAVPMEAILPLNWEKFYTNPVIGDDVADDVGTGVASFWRLYGTFYSNLFTSYKAYLQDQSATAELVIQALLRFLVLGEYVYSNGSLMSSLGIHGSPYLKVFSNSGVLNAQHEYDFDYFFDRMIESLIGTGINGFFVSDSIDQGVDDSAVYYVDLSGDLTPGTIYTGGTLQQVIRGSVINIRQCLEFFRDEPTLVVSYVDLGSQSLSTLIQDIDSDISQFSFTFVVSSDGVTDTPLNLARLWAYQISCAHFYTNDHVDYIYSATLFREYIGYLVDWMYRYTSGDNSASRGFTYNGVHYQYDYLSGHSFAVVLNYYASRDNILYLTSSGLNFVAALVYLSALFSYKRSLRFVDYFTGARSRPLAIGNVNVDVNTAGAGSFVSVIDITKNIQRQRFFNAVNRSGRKFASYMQELFGKAPAHDFHDPMYLGHTADVVFGSEIENTGVAQQTQANSVTSVLKSNSSRYGFEFDSDRDQIVIGICYYDISRNYSRTIERQNFHMNRFDMFNPYMQFIGDQAIYQAELAPNIALGSLSVTPFGYQNRHMEYKQRYNQASGGFVKNLPSWLFLADQDLTLHNAKISPSYIRSHPSELDRFFVSLTGYSLGSYFHFIVRSTNEVTASRPMAYSPSIL